MNAPCRGTGQVISGQANRLLRTTSSSCVGRPGIPGPSTDCSVTDGLRWIAAHHTVGCCDQPKRPVLSRHSSLSMCRIQ